MSRVLILFAAVLSGIGALSCGLVVWGARSDFVFRGCTDLPRAEWTHTANCDDGWFAQVVFGMLGAGLAALPGFLLIRWGWRKAGAGRSQSNA